MNLTPSFAGVGDLAFFEIVDGLPITDVVGRTKTKGLVRMLPPFNEGVYYMSLEGWSPRINPFIKVAKSSPDYLLINKVGFGKKSVQLIHSGGEIRLENEANLGTLPEVKMYGRVEDAKVDVTYYSTTKLARENFLCELKKELPNAGYRLERESFSDVLRTGDGKKFIAEDCEDYRFRGQIIETNPFNLIKFLSEYSPGKLGIGPIELIGFNNKELGSFTLSR